MSFADVRTWFEPYTAGEWTSNNPTLLVGELGRESDTGRIKLGDGSTVWTSLPYVDSGGSVTSVGLTTPAFLTVSGSPVTGSGTLAVSLATQAANLLFAGPTSGGAAAPTFRAAVLADIAASVLGTGTADATTYLRGDRTWQAVSSMADTRFTMISLASDDTNSTTSLSAIPNFSFDDLEADEWYLLVYVVRWRSDTTASGLVLSAYGQGASDAPQAQLAVSFVTTGSATSVQRWQTSASESGTLTTSLVIDAANEDRFAFVFVLLQAGVTTPNPQLLRYHGDTGATITVKEGTAAVAIKLS